MPSSRTFLFIVADETVNAGERDSMKSLAAVLSEHSFTETDFLFCKRLGSLHAAPAGKYNTIPISNALYAAIPAYDASVLHHVATPLYIAGVGNSTLATLITALHDAKSYGLNVQASCYITHMVNDTEHLRLLVQHNVTVFTPSSRQELQSLNPALASALKLEQIEAVPHTNNKASIEIDYARFMESPNGRTIQSVIDRHIPFVFVIGNAGSGIGETDIHKPYTPEEAYDHGFALGDYMEPDTALIITHGGPRNLADLELFGYDTIADFARGYQNAQKTRNASPVIITERFERNLPYNAIKAGYVLSRHAHCRAFISNAEGHGTMDGAIMHVDNRKVLLGMFPFEAVDADLSTQREAHLGKYNRLGIALLENDHGHLRIMKHPQEQHTPIAERDAAVDIIKKISKT